MLLIDAGNSSAKWVHFLSDDEVQTGVAPFGELVSRLVEFETTELVLCSSVLSEDANASLLLHAGEQGMQCWFAESESELGGLLNSYTNPTAMGADRWRAMLGAWTHGRGPCCVGDAGSALTIDFVAASGAHEGGYILPGTRMMRDSLFSRTERVRDADEVVASLAPGRSTAEAVGRGVTLAQIATVQHALNLAEVSGHRALYLSGGGAAAIAPHLDRQGLQAPYLVLEGLLPAAALHGVVGEVDGYLALLRVAAA